ncbi:MAG: SpoIID/LytB domain-containing protein [Solirubrobacteraceae bacterium]
MRPSYHPLLAVFAALTLAASGATRAGATTLVIDGAGFGHGVGMSQEGARGYAEHGWSYERILAHYYTGTSLGAAPAKSVVKVLVHGKVRRVPLERYVQGVVAAEVSADWPMAALEAQAVASRTYALTAHAGGAKFDVYSDTRSQMYLGKAAETPRTNAAVQATAGQIVTYGGKPAITYFFASSGGHTESAQDAFPGSAPEPWLVGVADPYDGGSLHRWTIELSIHEAGVRLRGLTKGRFKGVEVLRRGSSPRIVSAYILGSKGKMLVSGGQLAERLGMYATWAHFSLRDAHGTHPEPDLSRGDQSTGASSEPAEALAQPVPAAHVTEEGGMAAPSAPQPAATGIDGGAAAPA